MLDAVSKFFNYIKNGKIKLKLFNYSLNPIACIWA